MKTRWFRFSRLALNFLPTLVILLVSYMALTAYSQLTPTPAMMLTIFNITCESCVHLCPHKRNNFIREQV
jgi:hypothetical protein